jgi:hypothetical protein
MVRMSRKMAERKDGWTKGVVLGNGGSWASHLLPLSRQLEAIRPIPGFLTYQHALVLSTEPPSFPYPLLNPLPPILQYPAPPPIISSIPPSTTLPVVVETYTVMYGRTGPDRVSVICRVRGPRRERLVANADVGAVLGMHERGVEVVGRFGTLRGVGDGLHWIEFEEGEKAKM